MSKDRVQEMLVDAARSGLDLMKSADTVIEGVSSRRSKNWRAAAGFFGTATAVIFGHAMVPGLPLVILPFASAFGAYAALLVGRDRRTTEVESHIERVDILDRQRKASLAQLSRDLAALKGNSRDVIIARASIRSSYAALSTMNTKQLIDFYGLARLSERRPTLTDRLTGAIAHRQIR